MKIKRSRIVMSGDNEQALFMIEKGGCLVFTGSLTGDHRILADSSPERIAAHWDGYCFAAEHPFSRRIKARRGYSLR